MIIRGSLLKVVLFSASATIVHTSAATTLLPTSSSFITPLAWTSIRALVTAAAAIPRDPNQQHQNKKEDAQHHHPQQGRFSPSCSTTSRAFASSSSSSSSSGNNNNNNNNDGTPTTRTTTTMSKAWREKITLLTQTQAQKIDEELMSTPGFSVDQLMELAGLSVAQTVDDFLQHRSSSILLICGPGNNGGDGLVAARHLYHFGARPTVVYPKRPAKPLYVNLVKQCEDLGIEVAHALPEDIDGKFDAVVDAMFGFGSTGELRAPFDGILRTLTGLVAPIISVDIPSGWDVEKGDVYKTGFVPEALVSLTAPKKCASFFRGRHYLGGRFVPPKIKEEYQLRLPAYQGTAQFLEVEGWDKDEEEGGVGTGTGLAVTGVQGGGQGVGVEVRALGEEAEFVVVWVTAPSGEEAGKLAEALVAEDLAACVNMVPGVESVYKWEGKVEKGTEVLMMAKTRRSLLVEFSAFVKQHHSYEVPETIAAEIVGGSAAYMQWLRESTRAPDAATTSGGATAEGGSGDK